MNRVASRSVLVPAVVASALSVLFATASPARGADAPSASRLEISVIHAVRTDGGGFVDPSLRELPQLTHEQPFLRYNEYRLLDRLRVAFAPGKPVTDPLANGRSLHVTLLDVSEQAGRKRFHIRAVMDEEAQKPIAIEVTASENEPFFVAGPRYRGGALFIELVVR